MLCTLVFQSMTDYFWNEETEIAIYSVTENNNLWANYCVARAAVRYGHHKIAYSIFSKLTEQVSSEHFYFWLVCLKEMSESETYLLSSDDTLVNRLEKAIIHYNKAIAALKVRLKILLSKYKYSFFIYRQQVLHHIIYNSKRSICE